MSGLIDSLFLIRPLIVFMLKLKLLFACILMQSSMLAWGQPSTQPQGMRPAVAPAQPGLHSNAPNTLKKVEPSTKDELDDSASVSVDGIVCSIFSSHFDLFSLSFVLTSYSTYKVEKSCDEQYFYKITMASINAQSRVVTGSTRAFKGGAHAYTMDVNLSNVIHPFFSIGNLRFTKVGEVRINILEAIKKKTWDIANVVNITYSPLVLNSQIYYIWNVGTLIHRLVAPNGDTYIMYAYTNEIAKDINRNSLINLGGQLRLPEGWRYENVLLNKTITVKPTPLNNFGSVVIFDELNNFYVRYQK